MSTVARVSLSEALALRISIHETHVFTDERIYD